MKALYFLPLIAAVSSSAFAQAAIAGSAKAQSGVPLHGVMVQLASPALIEKARHAVTDDGGLYRIENLRPGTYAISFSLPGWRPYRREGIELSGSSTVVVDAELTVGTPSEAITVTAAVPVVDAHSLSRELALSGNVVRSIPSARSYNALLVLVPGVATNSNDIVTGTATTSFPVHGGRTNEGRLTLEGLTIGSPPSGNSATSYVVDVGTSEEVTFRTATGLGETETAGLVMNIVLRSGGNAMRGSVFASGSGDALQSDNLTPALRDQGLHGRHSFYERSTMSRRRSADRLRRIDSGISRTRTWEAARKRARTSSTISTPATRRSGYMRPIATGRNTRTARSRMPVPA